MPRNKRRGIGNTCFAQIHELKERMDAMLPVFGGQPSRKCPNSTLDLQQEKREQSKVPCEGPWRRKAAHFHNDSVARLVCTQPLGSIGQRRAMTSHQTTPGSPITKKKLEPPKTGKHRVYWSGQNGKTKLSVFDFLVGTRTILAI